LGPLVPRGRLLKKKKPILAGQMAAAKSLGRTGAKKKRKKTKRMTVLVKMEYKDQTSERKKKQKTPV